MRVLQSGQSWLPPTQHWLWVQLKHLPRSIESTVVANGTEQLDAHPWPDVRVAKLGSIRLGTLPRWLSRGGRRRFLVGVAKATGAVLVHSHFGHQGWEDQAAARRARLRHVVSFYGYDVARLPRVYPAWRRRYRAMFRSVDRVVCEGPFMARSVAQLGCPEAALRTHHLGIELDAVPFRTRHLAATEPLRVLMAATFLEKKGLPLGVRAVARFARRRPVELTVVGDATGRDPSRDEKQRILEAIADEGFGEHVRMLGFQPHAVLEREMHDHHLFLQPSRHAADGDCEGGAPVSLIEAAASGMAVVSTTHCDIPEVVVHGETGWLTAEGDVDGLVAGLSWWAERSDWESTLVAARRRIEAEFDAVKQGERLAAIYDELVGGASGDAPAGRHGGGWP